MDAPLLPTQYFRLDGEIAVVTRAGDRIGRTIALVFAAAGACVLVSDSDVEAAIRVASEISSRGGTASSVRCDETQEDDIELLIATTARHFGGLSVLVNNAGDGHSYASGNDHIRFSPFALTSAFRLSQLAAAEMEVGRRGTILNISCALGYPGSRFGSKAVLIHLTESIARDLRRNYIRVNAIESRVATLELRRRVALQNLQRALPTFVRRSTSVEIALAALFLCSPASAQITGQVLTVECGDGSGLG